MLLDVFAEESAPGKELIGDVLHLDAASARDTKRGLRKVPPIPELVADFLE